MKRLLTALTAVAAVSLISDHAARAQETILLWGDTHLHSIARGIYHGPRKKYLQTYLHEFVFRFNRRKTPHAAFRSLLDIAVCAKPVTYNMLIRPELCA